MSTTASFGLVPCNRSYHLRRLRDEGGFLGVERFVVGVFVV